MRATLRSSLAALPNDPASFREMVRSLSTEEWSAFLDDALAHGVLGVIGHHLDREIVPEPVWDSFVYRHSILTAWQGSIIEAFEASVHAFAAAALRVCALKGPALSARLYGDPAVRSSVDLDFLIAPHDLDRALSIMNRLGYTGKPKPTVDYLLRHGHHLHFARPAAPAIELHFQAYAGFGVTVPSSALMDRAVPYRFSDRTTVLVPTPEDEFIYLAVHAAGHSFARLLWLYDMKLVVLRNPELDWDQVVRRSQQANVSTALGFAVRLLVEWLKVPITPVLERFSRRGLRARAADLMLPLAATTSSQSSFDNLKGLVFTALLCDRPRSTLWLLQHHVLRSVRRRVQRTVPRMLPESWSG